MSPLGRSSVVQEYRPGAREIMRLSNCSFGIISWNASSLLYLPSRMDIRESEFLSLLEEARL